MMLKDKENHCRWSSTRHQQTAGGTECTTCRLLELFSALSIGGDGDSRLAPHCGTRWQPSQSRLLRTELLQKFLPVPLSKLSRLFLDNLVRSRQRRLRSQLSLANEPPANGVQAEGEIATTTEEEDGRREGGDRLVMMEGGEKMIGHAWLANLQNGGN
ncbi:hypothetical protein C0Q70_21256 [Pomacea canaliculata]|uniref:Uncharacterized protein n=1 Tax=Pomacea canaliculata TaxID=400727 RepID=A0A2T7NC22_POMCA|nr:hypothetical protein C0Q70_21256 [Pomacea canaliculata]